jgi:hypothetical protein
MPLPKQPLIGLTGLRRLVVAELVLHRFKECGAKAGLNLSGMAFSGTSWPVTIHIGVIRSLYGNDRRTFIGQHVHLYDRIVIG